MTERDRSIGPSLILELDQPLIGLFVEEDGREVVRYFSDESQADEYVSDDEAQAALGAIGAFSDLDWDEMVEALDRIRHDSPPTPPIEL